MKTALFLTISFTLLLFSCRKDSFITSPDANVSISADTLHYDTVFTAVGSVTQSFKIINDNNQKLRLSSVKLMGGSSSSFKMNVDGTATTEANGIEIEANDSVYVFVQVNVDPAAGILPFIIRDSIQISYNGNDQLVQLEAWGQNAHFLREKVISSNDTWTNDLPYVIQGYLYVNPGQTLTIEKGCRIYVHADAPIIVDGSLKVNGEKDTINRVYFRGDRLDDPYKDFPAAWPGIYFRTDSKDNVLNYAVIKNSYQAIATEGLSPTGPKLILNQCVIDNSYDAGIIALNSSITATNCLISDCGKNIALGKGGDYKFTHCTVVSYSNFFIQHKEPVLFLSERDGASIVRLEALFQNCIFWGESDQLENEVVVEKTGSNGMVAFENVLWRIKTAPANVTVTDSINNQDPLFDSIGISKQYYDFRINKKNSPAVGAGTGTSVALDLDGNPRPALKPDLGCFEKQ
ncbi:MAG: hypothetical protein ABI675_09710 [Chitinophagaceae bacterium]